MGLPSKRRTKSQKRRRASHFALGQVSYFTCSSCSKPVLPHHVCLHCGIYNGRTVLALHSKAEKKLKARAKRREKEAATEKAVANT